MKTKHLKSIMNVLLVSVFLILIACSKDEDPITEPGQAEQTTGELTNSNGITKEELEAHKGSIGIIIDARDIAKKGFLPVMAEIKVDATESDYSKELEIDEFTNLATLTFNVEDLSEAALKELKDGVPITVDIKDKDGVLLLKQEFSVVSFKENGTFMNINANELIAVEKPISFNPDISYYIQLSIDDNLTNYILGHDEIDNIELNMESTKPYFKQDSFDSTKKGNHFFLVPVPEKESAFYIKSIQNNFYLIIDENNSFDFSYVENIDDLIINNEFTLNTSESGNVYLEMYNGRVLKRETNFNSNTIEYPFEGPLEDIGYLTLANFRIIPATIQWEIESLTTVFMQPILPAVETSFGFNSTLVNCSQGTLEQEVGTEISEETTTTIGWEESIELSSESTYEMSATLSVTASASFFGTGVEATASATAGYSSTSGFTSSHSGFGSEDESKSQSFFSSRTIEVLPGTAVLVYDAYQTYSNVLVPFVQRFRVRGSDSNTNSSLNGEDIVSQFSFNNFNGVITKVGSDFVEVTVRGTVTLDNLIDTQSQVQEVESNCN